MSGTKEIASKSGYERVYDKKDVFEYKGKLWLKIFLGRKAFLLPLVDLVDAPTAIAWLDTNFDRNPVLAGEAVEVTAKILEELNPKMVAIATSSKSEWYITMAIQLASQNLSRQIGIVQLPGGTDVEEVKKNSVFGTVTSYTPVTGVVKYMGIPKNIKEIHALCPAPGNIAIVDDVRTTGETIKTMIGKLLLSKKPNKEPNIVLLAQEAPLDKNYPPILSINTTSIMAIPEIGIEELDRSKLTSIKQRELIPQAVEISK